MMGFWRIWASVTLMRAAIRVKWAVVLATRGSRRLPHGLQHQGLAA